MLTNAEVLRKVKNLTHLQKCVPALFTEWEMEDNTRPDSKALDRFKLHARMEGGEYFLTVRFSDGQCYPAAGWTECAERVPRAVCVVQDAELAGKGAAAAEAAAAPALTISAATQQRAVPVHQQGEYQTTTLHASFFLFCTQ